MDMMLAPLKKYADFQGRARRQEYWMWTLGVVIVTFVLEAIFFAAGGPRGGNIITALIGLVLLVFCLAIFIPALAVAFRRLHDTDRSAWWLLIGFVPLLGAIALIVFYCMDGTPGPNKFGPDPKGRGASNTVDTFS